MRYYIITGTSRGLGEALAERLAAEDSVIYGLSRGSNPGMGERIRQKGGVWREWTYDLNDTANLEEQVKRIFAEIPPETAEFLALINNAGVLAPIGRMGDTDADALELNLRVNLIAPMLLMNAFIRMSKPYQTAKKRILNISSGAGKKPYDGWGAYCTGKAGLDMLTRCIGVEQQQEGAEGVRVLSLAPGVVDTEMQAEIRSASPERFRSAPRFIALKEEGKLLRPSFVADFVVQLLSREDYPNGEVLDIRDLLPPAST